MLHRFLNCDGFDSATAAARNETAHQLSHCRDRSNCHRRHQLLDLARLHQYDAHVEQLAGTICRSYTNCGPKNATFVVRRFGDTNDALTVDYVIGGTAVMESITSPCQAP